MISIDLRTTVWTTAISTAIIAGALAAYALFVSTNVQNENLYDGSRAHIMQKQEVVPTLTSVPIEDGTIVSLVQPQPEMEVTIPQHMYQTFNNCGPATLSMYLSHLGLQKTQAELGNILRPYQNSQGDNDDKSVTLEELAAQAETYGYVSFHNPNGSVDLVKKFIANDIPLITRTWLNDYEDIGHYRVVRGYSDPGGYILQDDSYQGPNLEYSYEEFLSLWQAFNYEYLVIVPQEKEAVVEAILQDEVSKETAWQNTLERAITESEMDPQNPYPIFNQSVAHYHLGNYQQSVELYESVANDLPGRMLWYQIEPIQAYAELGQTDVVFSMTDIIFQNGNRAFSELYIIRGEVLEDLDRTQEAAVEFEKARLYNKNLNLYN